jgi:hypothetical protein
MGFCLTEPNYGSDPGSMITNFKMGMVTLNGAVFQMPLLQISPSFGQK